MKKYFIIFCSLLIMIISLFFVSPVFAASGSIFNRVSVDDKYYYTSIDNLQMIYLGETGQETNFFTSSTNSFPITDTQTISTSCDFSSSSTDITIQLDSRDTKHFNNIHDTMINYSNLGQSSFITFIQCYYGEFFMPVNRPWNNIGNTELRYLVEFNNPTELEIFFSCEGYYPVLTDSGFYMQPFSFDYVFASFQASEAHEFSLYSLLTNYADYSQYIHNNFLYIKNASISLSANDTEITGFSYYFNKLKSWQLPSIDDYEVSIDIDISPFGIALFNSVTNFLKFEIVPGFSLLDLLFYVVAVPLLLAILKIFLGG